MDMVINNTEYIATVVAYTVYTHQHKRCRLTWQFMNHNSFTLGFVFRSDASIHYGRTFIGGHPRMRTNFCSGKHTYIFIPLSCPGRDFYFSFFPLLLPAYDLRGNTALSDVWHHRNSHPSVCVYTCHSSRRSVVKGTNNANHIHCISTQWKQKKKQNNM